MRRFVFSIVAGGLIWLGVFAGDIYRDLDSVDLQNLPEVDAIVCLAGGRGRIFAAGDLWFRYWEAAQKQGLGPEKIPLLYISGAGPQTHWSVLTKQFRKSVLEKLQESDVIIEKQSSNTDANARYLAEVIAVRGWKKIILLTSSYHLRRAHLIFNYVLSPILGDQGVAVELKTYPVYQSPFRAQEWRGDPNGIRVTVMEYVKWLYYQALFYKSQP